MDKQQRRVDGFGKIFKIAVSDLVRAREILSNIDIISSDLDVLIRYQEFGDYGVRVMAAELARKIPAEELDLDLLIAYKESRDHDVRFLASELLRKIPIEGEAKNRGKEYVEILELFK